MSLRASSTDGCRASFISLPRSLLDSANLPLLYNCDLLALSAIDRATHQRLLSTPSLWRSRRWERRVLHSAPPLRSRALSLPSVCNVVQLVRLNDQWPSSVDWSLLALFPLLRHVTHTQPEPSAKR